MEELRKITQKKLNVILNKHERWLKTNGYKGEQAIFINLDLSYLDFFRRNLREVKFYDCIISDSRFSESNMVESYFCDCKIKKCNFTNTTLKSADFIRCCISNINLHKANLLDVVFDNTTLDNVYYDETTAFFALQCPEKGSFVGYKKVWDNIEDWYYIIEMFIPKSAKRSSATSRKCRASKVKVLKIEKYDKNDNYIEDVDEVINYKYTETKYKIDEYTFPDSFDTNRWKECSNGIHFFVTKKEAINYF